MPEESLSGMGLFSKIFHLFESNTPHYQLLDAYSHIHRLAKELRRELRLLRRLQKQLVAQKRSLPGENTGQLSLQKTLFVEEELLRKLRVLGKKAEERFSEAYETIDQSQPTSKLEQEEADRVIKYLKAVQSLISPFSSFSSMSTTNKLLMVETELR